MKVKELVALLQEMPQEQPVFLATIVEGYVSMYVMLTRPKAVFEKEDRTLVSLDLKQDLLKYMDTPDVTTLVEASSHR